jgi:hypothetical protein
MTGQLVNEIVIITGGSSGLGRATAELMLQRERESASQGHEWRVSGEGSGGDRCHFRSGRREPSGVGGCTRELHPRQIRTDRRDVQQRGSARQPLTGRDERRRVPSDGFGQLRRCLLRNARGRPVDGEARTRGHRERCVERWDVAHRGDVILFLASDEAGYVTVTIWSSMVGRQQGVLQWQYSRGRQPVGGVSSLAGNQSREHCRSALHTAALSARPNSVDTCGDTLSHSDTRLVTGPSPGSGL